MSNAQQRLVAHGAEVGALQGHDRLVVKPEQALVERVTQTGRTVTSRAVFQVTCDRVTPAEYAGYRAKVDEMVRLLEDELVVGKASGPPAKKPVPVKAR